MWEGANPNCVRLRLANAAREYLTNSRRPYLNHICLNLDWTVIVMMDTNTYESVIKGSCCVDIGCDAVVQCWPLEWNAPDFSKQKCNQLRYIWQRVAAWRAASQCLETGKSNPWFSFHELVFTSQFNLCYLRIHLICCTKNVFLCKNHLA